MQQNRSLLIVFSAGVLLMLIAYCVGWVVGALYGGNYATDVAWFGVRGYESTGALGGYIISACVGIFYAKKNAPKFFSLKSIFIPLLAAGFLGIWLPEALQNYELMLLMAFFPALIVLAQGREKEEKLFLAGVFFAILLLANLFMTASLHVPIENIWYATQDQFCTSSALDQSFE